MTHHTRKMSGRAAIDTTFMTTLMFVLLWCSTIFAHEPPITDIAFAPSGNSLVCCSQNGVQVLSWPNLTLERKLDVSFANLHCIRFAPDGKQCAVAGGYPSEEGIVQVFTWPDFKLQATLSGHDDSVVSVTWQGNHHLTSASLDRVLKRWDITTKKAVLTYKGHSRGVRSACILSTGELVTAGNDHSVRVWDTATGTLVRTLNQHSKPIYSISVCPILVGRPMIATAAGDRTIRFWQPTIGRMMRYIRFDSEPLDICWINETLMVASCVDGQARVVDTENVKVLHTIPAVTGWAYSVAAHPSDGTIAIAGSKGQIYRIEIGK